MSGRRLYDVDMLLPITVRVSASDEEWAAIYAQQCNFAITGGAALVSAASGFPEQVKAKEVAPKEQPI